MLIPHNVNPPDFFDGYRMKRSRYTEGTVSAGYAYNLILWKRLFVTASIILGPGAGYMRTYSETDDNNSDDNFHFAYTHTVRAAVGYNGKRLYAGFSYVNTSLHSPTPVSSTKYIFKSGNIRFNIAYRFPFNVDMPY